MDIIKSILQKIKTAIKYITKSITKAAAPRLRRALYSVSIILIIIIALDTFFPLPEAKDYSKVIYDSEGQLLTAYLSKDEKWRMQTHLKDVSPDLVKAILEKEDSWFYWHPGVNPYSIVRALFQNIIKQKRVSGASTITMQTARMLQPKERTYLNKLIEILRAIQLEVHYSKKEILELYLSLLPYGGNIEGIKSASYIYFGRSPDKLSLSQSIILAVIPNDPNDLRPDKNPKELLKERNKWIKIFLERKAFSRSELKDSFEEPVYSNRFLIRSEASHFCRFVAKNFQGSEIKTSLKLSVQQSSEKLLSDYIERVRSKGIFNGAVIIVDNKTNSIVAYCGSQGFQDSLSSGQVNGITALRSPGSTLKPALYAMAIDEGLITPSMRLYDIPTDFGGYEPENFDLKFRGIVTAKYALVNSLNIPAVGLLEQLGPDKFISLLIRAGLSGILKEKKSLGLSLILGGCSVRLDELVRLYTAFAHSGLLYPLNYIHSVNYIHADNLSAEAVNQLQESGKSDKIKAQRLFSPASSYLIATMLSTNQRQDFPTDLPGTTFLPQIAWKTGTSFGRRDAWAVGFNPDYTIGVWLGNFDSRGSSDLSGSAIAVPLLFELFSAADYKPKKLWFDRPSDLEERDVCSETGLLPGENCKNVVRDYYIKNVSPNLKCDLYKPVYVNKSETIQYCTECLPDSGYKKVFYPSYRPEVAVWLAKNNVEFKSPPPHNSLCFGKRSGEGPKIVSPLENYEYYIEQNTSQQIMLMAASDPSVKQIYWYIDNKFYKSSSPGDKLFFRPSKGKTKIVCLDESGRKASVSISVNLY
ncbi:MAG: penicillin-binding protein 1C [Bacteroidota bacterium]|nr:penicillin-binding protein 1C [Bacteroidota bacterium]MDP4193728.1 penicillin-binding protein 1C [Bacteroidota bacterium]